MLEAEYRNHEKSVCSTRNRDREKCQDISTALRTIKLINHDLVPAKRAVQSHGYTAQELLLPTPREEDRPKEKQSSQVSLDKILIPARQQKKEWVRMAEKVLASNVKCMSTCTQTSVLHLCAWVGVHERVEEGVCGGEDSLGRLVLPPAVQASFPQSTSLPKDIMPRPLGPAGEDIAAGSFEILQWNGWENPCSTLLLGAIAAVYFTTHLICRGGRRAGGHHVLGRRAGPPALWRCPSHTCPPCLPAPCPWPQPSWGQPGEGHPRGSGAEGAPRGSAWSGIDASQQLLCKSNAKCHWFYCSVLSTGKSWGKCKGPIRAYVPFQGTEVPHFDKNLTLSDGIKKFVQVSGQLSCIPAGGE